MKSTVVFTLATLAAIGATASPCQMKPKPTGPNGEPYVPGKWFDRYFMIIGENMDFWTVESQTTFANLWKKAPNGRLLANYYGATHPSQPNYFDHIAASTLGWNSDNPVNITGPDSYNIIDLLEEKGISWGGYAEDYPITQGCYIPYAPEYPNGTQVPNSYVRKHFPFVSFETIYTNETRCNNLYNANMFWEHLKEDKLPQFVYFTPNLLNDGHNTNASYFANYIQSTWIDTFYNNEYFNTRALNYLSVDESGNTTGFNTVPGDNNNRIYAAIWGDAIINRDTYDQYDFVRYNHSSITATLEMNWFGETGLLGRNDTYAPVFALPYDGQN